MADRQGSDYRIHRSVPRANAGAGPAVDFRRAQIGGSR